MAKWNGKDDVDYRMVDIAMGIWKSMNAKEQLVFTELVRSWAQNKLAEMSKKYPGPFTGADEANE